MSAADMRAKLSRLNAAQTLLVEAVEELQKADEPALAGTLQGTANLLKKRIEEHRAEAGT